MRVARYTKEIQHAIGCRVDAEPWMHVVFEKFEPNNNPKDNATAYAVYVWDTRKVLGTGFTYPDNYNLGANANDNHKPLEGGGRVVDIIGCNDTWHAELGDALYRHATVKGLRRRQVRRKQK